MTSVFRTCPIHHKPNSPVRLEKHGTVRTTQRTQGVSTFKLHCAAKTAKFFLARKLPAKTCKNMQNTLKATQTMRQLLQTTQVQNNVLRTKSQNMRLHTRAQNRGSNRNQIFFVGRRAQSVDLSEHALLIASGKKSIHVF